MRALPPLRLGLVDGGADLSAFCDQHGGHVLTWIIKLFARFTITESTDGVLRFYGADLVQFDECPAQPLLPSGGLALHRGLGPSTVVW